VPRAGHLYGPRGGLDVSQEGLTGRIAERALESCGIIIDKNTIPGDRHGLRIAGGIRLAPTCSRCAAWIARS
jgi:glycine/serine hydroxymethyltransferase